MPVTFHGLPTAHVAALRAGALDANGQAPERAVSDGDGVPCRHCLAMIAEGEPYLVLANRPFGTVQPYAEVGPIFLHADECPGYEGPSDHLPPGLQTSSDFIVRGYGADERIVYGTGGVVRRERIVERATEILSNPDVAFVHVRSSRNNCWQARIDSDGRNGSDGLCLVERLALGRSFRPTRIVTDGCDGQLAKPDPFIQPPPNGGGSVAHLRA